MRSELTMKLSLGSVSFDSASGRYRETQTGQYISNALKEEIIKFYSFLRAKEQGRMINRAKYR